METNKIAGVTEIYSAILSANIGDSANKLKADANGFVAENYGVDLSAYDVSVVENSESQVHLSLPYYTGLEEATAKAMADSDVADAAGGDIIAAIVLSIIGVAAAVGATGAIAGTAASVATAGMDTAK